MESSHALATRVEGRLFDAYTSAQYDNKKSYKVFIGTHGTRIS